MPANDTRKAYFLCNFPMEVVRFLEHFKIYTESEMHVEWRDQYMLYVLHGYRSKWLASSVWVGHVRMLREKPNNRKNLHAS